MKASERQMGTGRKRRKFKEIKSSLAQFFVITASTSSQFEENLGR